MGKTSFDGAAQYPQKVLAQGDLYRVPVVESGRTACLNNRMNRQSDQIATATLAEAWPGLHTLQDCLEWGLGQLKSAELFYGHGTECPEDEILYLVLGSLKLGPVLDPRWLHRRLTEQEKAHIVRNVRRRVNERLPTAYLVQQAWFAGLPFYVDTRVLIPRSPLAELIERQFRPWIDPQRVSRVLDLGTGSACIAIACAYGLPEVAIDAVDCSEDALAVALHNVMQHQLASRVTLIHSTGFSNLQNRHYDIIIGNPPYVNAEDFAALPAEYRHEPAVALAAGEDGLDLVVPLLEQAQDYLKPNGLLIVEVGNSQRALLKRFPHMPFMWLSFERGESEVFLLTREQLIEHVKEI